MVAHTCTWEAEIRKTGSKPAWANSSQDPISKITRAKWTGGVAQAVGCLLCKCDTLSSYPSFIKIKLLIKDSLFNWARVAHACDPSYSGGREQEDASPG
jgi:hypothetical protein